MCSLIASIFLHACESWTVAAELQRRIQAMELRCYHKILCISYKNHDCYQWGGPCKDPAGNQTTGWPHHRKVTKPAVIMDRYVSCSTGLAKTILHGTDRRRCGKITSGNGQAWSSPSPRGQWRTEINGRNWLWSNLWCPNDPHGQETGEGKHLCPSGTVVRKFIPQRKTGTPPPFSITCLCWFWHIQTSYTSALFFCRLKCAEFAYVFWYDTKAT